MNLSHEKYVGRLPMLLGFVLAAAVVFGGCNTTQQAQADKVANSMIDDSTGNTTQETTTNIDADGDLVAVSGEYVTYSESAFEAAADSRRVYFFHATWCPTCKVADKDLTTNANQIPSDVVVLRTDYDEETELKDRYDITYQHTFVQVDGEGNEVAKWSGGGVEQLNEKYYLIQ